MFTYTDGPGGDVQTYKDTYVDSNNPTMACGNDEHLGCYAAAEKFLLRFDLSGIPAGSSIVSAILYLYHYQDAGYSVPWTVDMLSVASGNAGWVEGVWENPGTQGQSTWNYKTQTGAGAGTAWAGSAGLATATTDYETTVLASQSGDVDDAVGTEYAFTFNASGLTRLAQWFGSNDANYGLLGIRNGGSGGTQGFCSSDHATAGYRPRLVVTYTAAAGGKPIYAYAQQ